MNLQIHSEFTLNHTVNQSIISKSHRQNSLSIAATNVAPEMASDSFKYDRCHFAEEQIQTVTMSHLVWLKTLNDLCFVQERERENKDARIRSYGTAHENRM